MLTARRSPGSAIEPANQALGVLAAKLSHADSLDQIASAIASDGPSALGASQCRVRLSSFDLGGCPTLAASDDAPVSMTGRGGLHALVCLPLQAHSVVIGSVAVGWDTARQFGPGDATLFTAFAELCSTAVERLRLARREHQISHELQLAMLGTVDRIDRLDVHTTYLPAEAGMEIGGDFYDAIALRHGRIGLVVGDIVGQGLAAATAMGQLRSMFRGAAMCVDDPAELLGLADHFARHIDGAYLCTMSYVVIDPPNERLTYASAGHPPPLLVRAGGSAEWLDGARTTPLGFSASSVTSASTRMRPGDTIVLYTDGLIERRSEPLDVGLERVRSTASAHWQLSPDQLAEALINQAFRAWPQGDDVALLIGQLNAERTRGFDPAGLDLVTIGARSTKERVLVVEESDDLVELIDLALSGDWEVLAVHDGAAALRLLGTTEVDMVIADASITTGTTSSLIESIRASPRIADTPVILLSGMGSTASTRLADAVLAKPFAVHRLCDLVSNLLIRAQR